MLRSIGSCRPPPRAPPPLSPDGKWFLYLKGGHVYSYQMETAAKTAIDGGRSFVNADDDHDYEKPVYGVAGFTSDGKSALLYDRYDVWALPLAGGTPTCLTRGEGSRQDVRYRVTQLGRGGSGGRGGGGGARGGGRQEPIDMSKPLLLSTYGEWTKKSGYSELVAGQPPSSLLWLDKSVGAPIAAKNADRLVFTEQTFNEYPNYWVADKRFASPRQVTDAQPDIFKEFAWGTKKLIDFKNSKGVRLQATLTLPAGYEPGKKYPMLVYFYELMSDTHHTFSFPVYDDRPHMSTYASNGYLVLQPDVRYEIGRPGLVRARLRHERRQEGDRARLRGPGAHRPAGPQLGRLPVVVHRHADRHLRGRRDRGAADGPDELLRHAVPVERLDPAGHHRGGPGAHGRGRDAVVGARLCTRASRRCTTRRRSRRRS